MEQIKITLQQLLSLYMGGRPVGKRELSIQREEFLDNYGKLSYLDLSKFNGKQYVESEEFNFKNVVFSIESQYPGLKKIKKHCREYMKKIPVMYEKEFDETIFASEEYKSLSNELMKKAREVMGKDSKFVVKNIKMFSR